MQRLVIVTSTLALVALLLAAGLGSGYSRYSRVAYLPHGLSYHIVVSSNVWPDEFYSDSYDMPQPRTLYFHGYWTFEPGKKIFSGPVWAYHPNELTLDGVDYTVYRINS